jgi:hypothetical protein
MFKIYKLANVKEMEDLQAGRWQNYTIFGSKSYVYKPCMNNVQIKKHHLALLGGLINC